MRAIVVLAVTCATLAACSSAVGGSAATTSLRIAYSEDGTGAAPDTMWTLRCEPVGGSLARPTRACTRLEAGGRGLFAPVSPKVACTEIYGGPQRARVTGLLDGRPVWSTFSRTDGCQIARWAKVSPWLLPPGGIT